MGVLGRTVRPQPSPPAPLRLPCPRGGLMHELVSPTRQEVQGRGWALGPHPSVPWWRLSGCSVPRGTASPKREEARPGPGSRGQLCCPRWSWPLRPGRDAACGWGRRVCPPSWPQDKEAGAALPPPSPVGAPATSPCPPVPHEGPPSDKEGPQVQCAPWCVCDQEPTGGGAGTPQAGPGAVSGRPSGPWEDPPALSPQRTAAQARGGPASATARGCRGSGSRLEPA